MAMGEQRECPELRRENSNILGFWSVFTFDLLSGNQQKCKRHRMPHQGRILMLCVSMSCPQGDGVIKE